MITVALSFLAGFILATLVSSVFHADGTANRSAKYLRDLDDLTTKYKHEARTQFELGRKAERALRERKAELAGKIEAWAVGKN